MSEQSRVQSAAAHHTRAAALPRLVAATRRGWRAAADAWRQYPDNADNPDFAVPAPILAFSRRTALLRQRVTSRSARRRMALGLVVFIVVVASCGLLNVSNGITALAAARDAKAQVNAIQTALKGGATDAAHLREAQSHLNALALDIQRLQTAVPMQPVLSRVPGTSGMVHLLLMASDLVQAGQAAMPAAIILAPHLKEMTSSLQGSATSSDTTGSTTTPPATSAPQVPAPPPLTVADVQQASAALDRALPLLQAALAERSHVSDMDLRLIGLGKYVPLLHQLDGYSPYLPKVFSALHEVTAALPTLLGVGQPTTFVLFSLDSDELRPTGGFMGNYALLTLDGGKLTSGVHLQDMYSLDCPKGLFHCPARPIPSRFAWLSTDPTHFGLRDSNLDPDYPTSARLAEELLQVDGAPAVQGVFSITPRVIEQILEVTGPITVVSYCTIVTSQNLRDVIHYYHLASPLGITSWCPGPQQQSANRKAFDAELGTQLMHRLAILPQSEQRALVKSLLEDFATRDIQLYFNDPHLQSALTTLGIDGTIKAPQGDSLFVVDANAGATYANSDVQEHVVDNVTLDARGTATHNLTLTYAYPKSSHIYSDVHDAEGIFWTYEDFVRVMVPQQAQFIGQDGCPPTPTDEPGHMVWGCQILFAQPNTVTLHFRWSTPGAATVENGTLRYRLLMQHQPGTRHLFDVTITAPGGYHLADTHQVALGKVGDAQVTYHATLSMDQALDLSFQR